MDSLNLDVFRHILSFIDKVYHAHSLVYISKLFNQESSRILRNNRIISFERLLHRLCSDFDSSMDMYQFEKFGINILNEYKEIEYNSATLGNLDLLKCIHKYMLDIKYVDKSDSSEVEHPHKNRYIFDEWTCAYVAQSGSLECLKYLHKNGASWNKWTCANATGYKSLECLIYLHENGCEWDKQVCRFATGLDSLECLKYAHENGCPWDKSTCSMAAMSKSLECLKYAHENGASWDEEVCFLAARANSLECLKYAHENGCPWNEETCIEITMEYNSLKCLEYLRSHI